MSRKCSVKYEHDKATGRVIHLYREAFDEDNLYLNLEGFHFEAASSMDLSGQWGPRLTVKLPQVWAQKLGLIGGPASIPAAECGAPDTGSFGPGGTARKGSTE